MAMGEKLDGKSMSPKGEAPAKPKTPSKKK
jgi:hypothetical protein